MCLSVNTQGKQSKKKSKDVNLNCISQKGLNLIQKAPFSSKFIWIHDFPRKEILYSPLYLQTALQAYKIYRRHLIKPEMWANEPDFKNGGLVMNLLFTFVFSTLLCMPF